jgi:hypothetical protein
MRQACLDPADECSVDTSGAGTLGLGRASIDPDPLELVAKFSFDPAHPGRDDAGERSVARGRA